MSDRRTAHDLAVATLSDATVIAELITATRRQLEQERGGYPTHTPGAAAAIAGPPQDCRPCLDSGSVTLRPCALHDRDELGPDTPVERLAGQRDPAADALARLDTLTRKLAMYSAEAATICVRWGLPGLTTSAVADRLAEIDSEVWCAHCSAFGNHEPRAAGERHCRVCADYKRRYNELPSKAIWRARDARGGKLITQDVARIRAREAIERKARKKSA